MSSPSTPDLRLLVVEDQALAFRAYQHYLEPRVALEWAPSLAAAHHAVGVGDASTDGCAALHRRSRFQGFVVDLRLPDGSGWTFVDAIRAVDSDVPILVIAGIVDAADRRRAFELTVGLQEKGEVRHDLEALEKKAREHRRIRAPRDEPDVEAMLSAVLDAWLGRARLTPRERQFALAIARGLDLEGAARHLDISANTAKTYSARIRTAARVESLAQFTAELFAQALRRRP